MYYVCRDMDTAEKGSFYVATWNKSLCWCHSTASIRSLSGAAGCKPHLSSCSFNQHFWLVFSKEVRPFRYHATGCLNFSNSSNLTQSVIGITKCSSFTRLLFLSDSRLLRAVSSWNHLLWVTSCTNPEVSLPHKLFLISILYSHACIKCWLFKESFWCLQQLWTWPWIMFCHVLQANCLVLWK